MVLPNFLIVGAAKSGTTSLYDYLGQHPDLFFSDVKGSHFFSNSKTFTARNLSDYQDLFARHADEKAVGETCVSYLYDPSSPERIKSMLGTVRIIISLRNPVDRAFSHWQYFYNLGWEDLSFEGALVAEETRFYSTDFQANAPAPVPSGYFYYRRGLYASQVRRYLETFGTERVKVLIFEEWVRDPVSACQEIFEFLEIEPTFTPKIEVKNAAHVTRSRKLHDLLVTRRPKWITAAYQNSPVWLRNLIFRIGKQLYWANMAAAQRYTLPPDLRAELLDKYQDEIKSLELLLQRDLSGWYSGSFPSRQG
jgi:hypothetical protein